MKTTILTIILLLGIGGAATAQSTQRVLLRNNQEKNITGSKFSIKFVSVVEDSRCPVGTTCIWAGNAKVKIQIGKKNGSRQEFVLNTTLDPTTVEYKGYAIRLVGLSPKPGEMVKAMVSNKTAVFEITRIKH